MSTASNRPTDAHWQAQERALQRGDARADRLLSQALRTMPVVAPPPDFARQAVLALRAQATERQDRRFEGRLLGALAFASVLALLISAWRYGAGWRPDAELLSGQMLAWGACVAACLALAVIPWRWPAVAARLGVRQG